MITVRCGDEEYDGYFCHPVNPKPGKWPAVLFLGGADAYAEEIYFGGKQMLERGWAMLLVDTPGRGSSIYLRESRLGPIMKCREKRVSTIWFRVPRSIRIVSRCSASAWPVIMRRESRHSKKNQGIGGLERLLQRA